MEEEKEENVKETGGKTKDDGKTKVKRAQPKNKEGWMRRKFCRVAGGKKSSLEDWGRKVLFSDQYIDQYKRAVPFCQQFSMCGRNVLFMLYA
jgi:hypothetical protein